MRHLDIQREALLARHLILAFILCLLAFGLASSGFNPGTIVKGLAIIIASPDILINDYAGMVGFGPACVNAALCALAGYVALKRSKVHVSGPAIASVFTIMGFALFGKNIGNIWPSMLGVFLFSLASRRPFSENVLVALFGTALAPLTSEVAFGLGLAMPWNWITALGAGTLAGFLLSPIARHVLDFHRGYNLYNIGFAAGFIGTITLSLIKAAGGSIEPHEVWGSLPASSIAPFLVACFTLMMIAGPLLDRECFAAYRKLLSSPGRLVSDFVRAFGIGATVFNMGLMGLVALTFVWLTGSDWNGPMIGGVLTIVGFSAFGKHPLNALPPMIGVCIVASFSSYGLGSPTSQLAILFSSTLAPVSGTYGPAAGIIAGMLHFVLVQTVGVLHGGLNLYNNGFAGGMAAGILVPILEWVREWRRHEV